MNTCNNNDTTRITENIHPAIGCCVSNTYIIPVNKIAVKIFGT